MKIAVICGGPSLERGISLNSARSVADHLEDENVEIVPIYFDYKKRAYAISRMQLYSNTPSDFDFKLKRTAKFLSKNALKNLLKSVDLAFPVMHGAFGEDGGIQRILEKYKVPYVGSGVDACKKCFDKFDANEFIKSEGFFGLPSAVLKIYHDDHKKIISEFFKKNNLKRAIVKPATGGSSIGVYSVSNVEDALEKVQLLFSKRIDTRVVIEPFCEGIEFTVIILQNRFRMPVAVLPTEIETDYEDHQIFDFRKKYLPTRQVKYHCPPRFDNETIERIQVQAEQLFKVLGMRDFARFDGWLLPDGKIWFSDFNPISGMEQNSFLFQQSARVGLSHRDLLRHIVGQACARNAIKLPLVSEKILDKKPVKVLFGGPTSERQVSLMSGTNVWLKLRRSKKYAPEPYLLDLNGDVWRLPYALTLNHTVEEVMANCENAEKDEKRLSFLKEKVSLRLGIEPSESFFVPEKISLQKFIKGSEIIFLGLHGGNGENGVIQKKLEDEGVKFNGSGSKASAICMDKFLTGEILAGMENEGIFVAPKKLMKVSEIKNVEKIWIELVRELGSKTLIVKPHGDGCSSGIARLFSAVDLQKYLEIVKSGLASVPKGTLKNQTGILEMPQEKMEKILLEKFIETDSIRAVGNKLRHKKNSGFVEVTVGVLAGHALSPSITIAESSILSVEEKFQGGTGINITPPSEEIVAVAVIERAKKSIEKVAKKVGISGYARIDAFLNIANGDIIVIEINTLPGLTASTVLYHQGLAEKTPIFPVQLLEKLID